jgi:hypothetical protein
VSPRHAKMALTMHTLELHRYTYTNAHGRRLVTRHHLTADEACRTLPTGAEPLAHTRELRLCPETMGEMARACTGSKGLG